MFEAVTMPNLMMTSIVSDESLARGTHTHTHTNTHIQTHTHIQIHTDFGHVYLKLFQSHRKTKKQLEETGEEGDGERSPQAQS